MSAKATSRSAKIVKKEVGDVDAVVAVAIVVTVFGVVVSVVSVLRVAIVVSSAVCGVDSGD